MIMKNLITILMKNLSKFLQKSSKIYQNGRENRCESKPWSWSPRGGRFAPEPPLKNGPHDDDDDDDGDDDDDDDDDDGPNIGPHGAK